MYINTGEKIIYIALVYSDVEMHRGEWCAAILSFVFIRMFGLTNSALSLQTIYVLGTVRTLAYELIFLRKEETGLRQTPPMKEKKGA